MQCISGYRAWKDEIASEIAHFSLTHKQVKKEIVSKHPVATGRLSISK